MTRTKVKLEYIQNDTTRRVTYRKRSRGLLKKSRELSVLCGVDTCVLIYSPYSTTPLVWPSIEDEAKRIMIEFKMRPMAEQSQRRFNQEKYLRETLAKAKEKLGKLQSRNRELEMENLIMNLLDGKPLEEVPIRDLGDLLCAIDDKLRIIQHRIGMLEGSNNALSPPNYPNLCTNESVNHALSGNHFVRHEMLINGIHNVMGVTPPWEMETTPSQFPSGNGQPMNGDGCDFG